MGNDFDYESLGLDYSKDEGEAFSDYVATIANKGLLEYKQRIHTGGKQGESLFTHIMNLVTLLERLRPTFALSDGEMRCMLLALSTHDLNKLPEYGKNEREWNVRYALAAARTHIHDELVKLQADLFFPAWEDYLYDIVYLAHAHQVGTLVTTVIDQRFMHHCLLDERRLEGPLSALMKGLDVSDNSHSGEYTTRHEKHIRDKLLHHVNTAMSGISSAKRRRFRFVGHRLAEQRGLLTNVMHREIVGFFQERYGADACLDVLYHPEGVDYLLDTRASFEDTLTLRQQFAARIAQRLASLQESQLTQFIKGKPSGISVDDAAIQSGASLERIFGIIYSTVQRKQYRLEWREEKSANIRKDLEQAYTLSTNLIARINELLVLPSLMPADDEGVRRGEFLMAYRNFLKDHRSDQLKLLKMNAWERVARLYQLAPSSDTLYELVDPYRRSYFMARDLPAFTLDEMLDAALLDLYELEQEALQAAATRKAKKGQTIAVPKVTAQDTEEADTTDDATVFSFDISSLLDYLERNLELWEAFSETSTETRAIQTINFADTFARYANPKQQHVQCCYCGSALLAGEWMSLQVPPSIGVQSFSNRLEAGSTRDPKRNVCDICRAQFVLEKLAWPTHRDKQDSKQTTFYLHLFPYSHFTKPMLSTWWQGIQRMRGASDRATFFLDMSNAFETWKGLQGEVRIDKKRSQRNEGVGIPMISDAISNTPVLPVIMTAQSYSQRFLLALETTIILASWFDCRVILSRMPIPSLNLATQYSGDEPIALMVENAPRALNWLLSEDVFTRTEVEHVLYQKLSTLYAITHALSLPFDERDEQVYDLIVSAAEDPLALYYEVDRLIERNATRKRGGKPEYEAIHLSSIVAGHVRNLMKIDEMYARSRSLAATSVNN